MESGQSGYLAYIIAAIAVVGLTGCGSGEDDAKKDDASAVSPGERMTRVETVRIESLEFTSYETLTGETEAEDVVTVSAENPGRVLATNFEEGAAVTKGQWLIKLDARMDATRIGQLRVALQQAERDLVRARELVQKGVATTAQLEQAQLAVDSNRYNLRLARVGVSHSKAVSPIDGVVDSVHIEKGEYAGPGSPVVTIVNFDTIIVRAGLPESALSYAKAGQKVRVNLIALGKEVEGVVRRIGIQANTKSRTFPIQVAIDNKDHTIRPGMRADVVLPTVHIKDGVMIPRTALLESLNGSALFVFKDGKAQRRPTKTGPGKGAYVLVEKGLALGEELIVVGQQFLTNNEQVKVTKTEACCQKAFAEQEASTP